MHTNTQYNAYKDERKEKRKERVYGYRKVDRNFHCFVAIDALTFHRCNGENTYYFVDFCK